MTALRECYNAFSAMKTPIPIIDIFAGPGGLGEGFSALKPEGEEPIFKIKLSIEKDVFAHQTLMLRAFFRQFKNGEVPTDYYEYLKGNITKESLFRKHPVEAKNAKREAWRIELKKANREKVKSRIKMALNGATDWLLIGGPPCQAYSVAGRSRMMGGDKEENKKKYSKDRRHFLYKEYLQILADHQPTAFVMENVKGLLSSEIKKKKTFKLIISDLKNPLSVLRFNTDEPLTYKLYSFSTNSSTDADLNPEDYIVRSEEYGIPQARHRVFIFGIRSDVHNCHFNPLENTEKVSVSDVISDLPPLRSGLSKENDTPANWHDRIKLISTTRWYSKLPSDIQAAGSKALANVPLNLSRGKLFLQETVTPSKGSKPEYINKWYEDKSLGGVCNHETRSHIVEDLHRYFFASVFAKVRGRSPTLADFPPELLPNHNNVQKALAEGSLFSDRFRVQVGENPSTTVVSHISKDGHYYIHYDPSQCRSLTVREAARLQTFPDNYFFEGARTQQYHQVGNAVPPLLANKIALIVLTVFQSLE